MGLGHWRGGGGKWSSGCDLGLRGGEERKGSTLEMLRFRNSGQVGCLLQACGPCLNTLCVFLSLGIRQLVEDNYSCVLGKKIENTVPPVLMILQPLPLVQIHLF